MPKKFICWKRKIKIKNIDFLLQFYYPSINKMNYKITDSEDVTINPFYRIFID